MERKSRQTLIVSLDNGYDAASCSVRRGCLRVMRVCHRWWCGVGGDCGGVSMFGVDVCGRVVVLSL